MRRCKLIISIKVGSQCLRFLAEKYNQFSEFIDKFIERKKMLTLFCKFVLHLAETKILATPACPYLAAV